MTKQNPQLAGERTQYQRDLESKITELVNWCIDKRGWSRLSCAGEIAAATKRHYDAMSKRVSFV